MKSDRVCLHTFETPALLVDALAEAIADNLADAITNKGSATLMVSGGSTPKALFEALSHIDLGWKQVTVGLVDERWVDGTHHDSNAKLVREHLLQHCAKKATFIEMYIPNLSAHEAEKRCHNSLEAYAPFDVIILGMGGDAHTASLFPNNPRLDEAYKTVRHCIAITPQDAPHERMSLSLYALLHVKHLYLHFEGSAKKAVFDQAMQADDPINMPISAVLHNDKKDVEVYYA